MTLSTDRDSWYRRTSWTPADQEAFGARLRRSRDPFHRAQYLRIQALCLEQAGIVEPAVALLEQALVEDPAGFDVAEIHHQLGTCREKQGKFLEAVEDVRRALTAETSNRRTGAWLTFGRMVVEHEMPHLYDEVLAVIKARTQRENGPSSISFPFERYLMSAILAVINARRGREEAAKRLARAALSAAAETSSGLRYHPQVGLVTDRETRLYELVVPLAQDG